MTSISSAKVKTKYRDTLDHVSRDRYDEKLLLIGGRDPYEDIASEEWSKDKNTFPDVTYIDIMNYLVNGRSAYTFEELKAYKSLEAYNQFVCGWVTEVCHANVNHNSLLLAKVRHSQRLNDPPLKPWVIASKNGIVQAAHCNCMAGLGEACSHIGAVLFFLEAATNLRKSTTVTEKPAYWKLPPGLQKAEYKKVKDTDFRSAKGLKKLMDNTVNSPLISPRRQTKITLPNVPKPTEERMTKFLQQLKSSNTRSVILSVKEGYSDDFVPKCADVSFPPLLSSLYSEDNELLSEEECAAKCEEVFDSLKVTQQQCDNAERSSRDQINSKSWHHLRTGRVTASQMKSVCATSVDNPSKSLVKTMCYPWAHKFSTAATRWGCDHEQTALQTYCSQQADTHFNFKCEKSGFFINPKYPHIGASPDALVSCDCCGVGTVEIKCPYCVRSSTIKESVDNVAFLDCVDGEPKLKTKHSYFYQVQTQLFVCDREFCDFVTWTQNDMHVQRIEPDDDFWDGVVSCATKFFKKVILPELIGKTVTRKLERLPLQETENVSTPVQSTENSTLVICVCQQVYDADNDNVIGCDDENCRYQWFHFSCVNIKRVPKGTWYCSECKNKHRPLSKKNKLL